MDKKERSKREKQNNKMKDKCKVNKQREEKDKGRVPSGLPIKCGIFSLKMWEFNIALNHR